MTTTVRRARIDDREFVGRDGYISNETLQRKIEAGEVLLAEREGKPVGYLRLEYLWSDVPYIALIHVLETLREQGIGRALLGHLEQSLHNDGHKALYSSSQADEAPPQAWHRHMGFVECGFIAGINEGGIGEVFFCKAL